MARKRIILLVGPTAVGKSSLALHCAPRLDAEIVTADSMQVYRGMDIGTAKPGPRERDLVLNPDESFDAARYQREADRSIGDILARGRTALVVGGTGLYIRALLRGLFHDPSAKREMKWEAKALYYRQLGSHPHKILSKVDKSAADRIHPSDVVRAQRALDVFLRTGRSITDHQDMHSFQENRYSALMIGLTRDRSELYRRINCRVDEMMRTGLLEEVLGLIRQGYSVGLPSMRGLGYRHMVGVLTGKTRREEAVETLKRDTRRYAKRQYNWFYRQESPTWFSYPFPQEEILATIREFLDSV
jgi:tRNA dimethylallyltransferase